MANARALSMNLHYCDQCGMLASRLGEEIPAHQPDSEKVFCAACLGKKSGPVAIPRKKEVMPYIENPVPEIVPERRARPVVVKSLPVKSAPNPLLIGGISFAAVVILLGGYLVLSRKGSDATAKNSSTSTSSNVKPPETKVTPLVSTGLPQILPPAPTGTPITPTPLVAPTPTTASPNTISTPPKPTTPEDDYDPRRETSNLMLKQAKAFFEKNSGDVIGYREKLLTLKERYAGTPAATEATQIIPTLKLPEANPDTNPDLTPEGDWANATQILQSVDPSKDRINSNWSYANGVLKSDGSMWARIGFPYTLPEEYDLRLTFMRPPNGDCLLIILGRRGHPFLFSIGSGNKNCSFEDIKEKAKDYYPTKTQRDAIFTHNQMQQVVVQVRKQCLRGYLNGKPIVGCQVDDEGLNLAKEMQLPNPNQVGLATWASEFQFTKLEVLPLKGNGQFLR